MSHYKLPESFDKVTCPKCGCEFAKIYARAKNCLSCNKSVMGCPFIRCPKCDHEFPVEGLRRFDTEFIPKYMKEWGDTRA